MERYDTMKYIYDDIEKALRMLTLFVELFQEQGVYQEHEMCYLRNGRFLLTFKLSG